MEYKTTSRINLTILLGRFLVKISNSNNDINVPGSATLIASNGKNKREMKGIVIKPLLFELDCESDINCRAIIVAPIKPPSTPTTERSVIR